MVHKIQIRHPTPEEQAARPPAPAGELGGNLLIVECVYDKELAALEQAVVSAAILYVKGVGYDSNSLQEAHDAVERFAANHIALINETKALIAARESNSEET